MSKIYIYSRGDYEALDKSFLENKAIIRIHNIKDKNWYPQLEDKKLVLFFEDLKLHQIPFVEKIKAILGFETKAFHRNLALQVIKYIKDNKEKDFIIHCEYGKSRSVAIALFIQHHYLHNIENKKSHELQSYNDWVSNLLKKFY